MSDTHHNDENGTHSWTDCVDFWFDGPGDHTVRPIPPERLDQAKALRDRILAANGAPIECVDVWLDGPGDHTVRPIPPERLEQAKALRDRILAAEEAEKQKSKSS